MNATECDIYMTDEIKLDEFIKNIDIIRRNGRPSTRLKRALGTMKLESSILSLTY